METRSIGGYEVSAEPYKATGGGWISKAVIYGNDGSIKLDGDKIFDSYEDAIEDGFRMAECQ